MKITMVEVFKTNVMDRNQSAMVTTLIEQTFAGYKVNFDLADCDRILRVKAEGSIDAPLVICLLKRVGVHAEVLPDDIPQSYLTPTDEVIL